MPSSRAEGARPGGTPRATRRAATLALCIASLLVSAPGCDRGDAPGGGAATTPRATAAAAREADRPLNEAVALLGQFEFDRAAVLLDELAAKPDAPPEAALGAAIAILNRSVDGAQDEGIARLERFLATDPPKPLVERARYCMGLCLLYLGRPDEAAPLFVAVAEAHGDDPYAAYFAGQSLEQVGEDAKALVWYGRATEIDPLLKSAFLGVQRTARKTGDEPRSERALAAFETLAANPRARNAEFIYTRMGPLGRAPLPSDRVAISYEPPAGPILGDAGEPVIRWPEGFEPRWSGDLDQHATTVDLDGDGRLDLVIGRALMMPTDAGTVAPRTLVLRQAADGTFDALPDHPFARLAGARVESVLWGDIDGDGRTDAYLCRRGGNALLLATADGGFRDATAEWNARGPGEITVDGALADLDHDGDLDVLLLAKDAPIALLANLGATAGGFRDIAAEAGLVAPDRSPRSVVVSDLDFDRDADILVLHDVPPHQLFLNERLWKWREGTTPGVSEAQLSDQASGVAIVELADIPLRRAVFATGTYLRLPTRIERLATNAGVELAATDLTGDGHANIVVLGKERIAIHDAAGRELEGFAADEGAVRTQAVVLDPLRGAALLTMRVGKPPLLREPGTGRANFAALSFGGRDDPSQQMRSNTSGIGTSWAARIGREWFGGETFRNHGGRGQSLAPVPLGTGPFDRADFVEIEWSDGVFQTEVAIAAGETHRLVETQRQISSCPVLFAWNGERMAFVSDLLGVGGLGYLLEPGVYSEPRPWESFVLPEGALVARDDGRLHLALAEPMEESCMLDEVALAAIDLPEGWHVAPDERLAIGGAAPTGEPVAWRREWAVRGNAALAEADLRPAPVGPVDPRFIGRLADEVAHELDFGVDIASLGDPWLVIDGWVEYPYCQTMFAAWQAGARYRALGLEVRKPGTPNPAAPGADEAWITLVEEWGYPAGMPRRMALPIPKDALPAGATTLRLATNMEIHLDRVVLVDREPLPVAPVACPLAEATLASVGFARRTTGPERQPMYDRDARTPLWDCRFQRGLYTAFGDVRGLVSHAADAFVVFGPGEEVALAFDPPPPVAGTRRLYALTVKGWCKDMDLFTRDGETIEPLPPIDGRPAMEDATMRATCTRPMGGR